MMDELDRDILITLVESGMNQSEVARRLYVHRNTIVYRLNKIRKTTGLDPLNVYDLIELIKRMKGENYEHD